MALDTLGPLGLVLATGTVVTGELIFGNLEIYTLNDGISNDFFSDENQRCRSTIRFCVTETAVVRTGWFL